MPIKLLKSFKKKLIFPIFSSVCFSIENEFLVINLQEEHKNHHLWIKLH